MKKNLALILCIVVVALACLASCNNACNHTFSEEWYGDETHHWHPATCEHAETERSEYGAHVDSDANSFCDICGAHFAHTHTYEDAWQTDDFHHWKNPTCPHTDPNETYALHSDEDLNGVCEVCEGHVHNLNGAGYCKFDYCGKKVKDVDETNLDDLINAVYLQSYLVNGGEVNYDFIGRSNTNANYEASRQQNIVFKFGKDNYTYTKVSTSSINSGVAASDVVESWHQLDGVDRVFGVVSTDGAPIELDLPEVGRLNGYHIDLSDLAGDYGVEAALFALYEAAISETTDELVVIPDTAENKVVFKYSYKTFILNTSDIGYGDNVGETVYNLHYYEVEVEFRYNDDFALTSLDILVDCYTSDPGTADGYGFLYKDVDIIYDPDTDTVNFVEYIQEADGTWTAVPTDKRTPDTYTVSVSQTVGSRTEENPNPKSKFIPSSFDIYSTKEYEYDSNGSEIGFVLKDKITSNIVCDVGEIVNIYPGNYSPTNTSLHMVADQVSIKLYKDGVVVENVEDYLNTTAVAMFTGATEEDRTFFVVPKMDGVYKLEIYLMGNLVKTVNIVAGMVNEEDIELKDNEFAVKITEAYEWANEYTFTATTAGTYYFNLPAGVGFIDADGWDAASVTPETDDGPEPYFDYNDAKNPGGGYIPGSFHIDLEEGQSIRFYVNAVKKGTVIVSFFCL